MESRLKVRFHNLTKLQKNASLRLANDIYRIAQDDKAQEQEGSK